MSDPRPVATPQLPSGIAQVGRQPILDRDRNTYGYELLYRAAGTGPAAGLDGDQLTARTMLNAFLEFGLHQLVGEHRAFINLSRGFFTARAPLPLDKDRLVLEILEDIPVDEPLLSAVKTLHDSGYQMALDDYRFESRWNPLINHVDLIKVDIRGLDLLPHRAHIDALKQRGLVLLAEKVETEAEFALTRDLGFDLFQGYFFARPHIISGTRLDCDPKLLIRLLARINDPASRIDELASLVALDAKLSLKILRFINAGALGLTREVSSIREAVVYVGLNKLRGWASLLAMAGVDDIAPEIITTSLVRAELCEHLARAHGEGDPDSAYTVGLLSVLDAVLHRPMAELTAELGLAPAMTEALIDHTGVYGKPLSCALALEQGQWLMPAAQVLPLETLSGLYVDALSRAQQAREALD